MDSPEMFSFRNRDNHAIFDTDIPHRIELCFRIHDTAIQYDNIIVLDAGGARNEAE